MRAVLTVTHASIMPQSVACCVSCMCRMHRSTHLLSAPTSQDSKHVAPHMAGVEALTETASKKTHEQEACMPAPRDKGTKGWCMPWKASQNRESGDSRHHSAIRDECGPLHARIPITRTSGAPHSLNASLEACQHTASRLGFLCSMSPCIFSPICILPITRPDTCGCNAGHMRSMREGLSVCLSIRAHAHACCVVHHAASVAAHAFG